MKRAISIFLVAIMILSLTACGGGKEVGGDAPDAADEAPAVADEAPANADGDTADADGFTIHQETLENGEVMEWKSIDRPLSEYLSSGRTIWYYITPGDKALGREAPVYSIFVLEPDGTTIFAYSNMNLGELAQMTDEEIIAMVQTDYTDAESRMDLGEIMPVDYPSDMTYEEYVAQLEVEREARNARIEEFYTNRAPAQYKLSIITDRTGNNTESEVFAIQYQEYDKWSDEVVTETSSQTLSQDWGFMDEDGVYGNCYTVVYDSLYGGFFIYGRNGVQYFYTRVNANYYFELDETGTVGIPLDVNAESLFD